MFFFRSNTNEHDLSKPPTLGDIPKLVQLMFSEDHQRSHLATKRLYELCDVGHKQNRVPMVCGAKNDVITPLIRVLNERVGNQRHVACLALNNLSIPLENKRVMALGSSSGQLISALCRVMEQEVQEAYLCCITLMNLSFLEDSIDNILQYYPVPEGKELIDSPLDSPHSLLRILEKVLTRYSSGSTSNTAHNQDKEDKPLIAPSKDPKIRRPAPGSQESEYFRWACGLISNLAKSEENALLIAKTGIPGSLVVNIKHAGPASQWPKNCLEDFSLSAILNLSQFPFSRERLQDVSASYFLRPIMKEGGLMGLKATMACAMLGCDWYLFPEGGIPAARSVYELISNTIQKQGKRGEYDYGIFKITMALQAYRDLAMAAAKSDADSLDNDAKNIKVLATPAAVVLCLEIIAEFYQSVMAEDQEETQSDDKFNMLDSTSAEYALGVIHELRKVILLPETKSTDKTCREVGAMLRGLSEVEDLSSEGRSMAKEAGDLITRSPGFVGPIATSLLGMEWPS
jgi:hypothetical protein